MSLANYNNEAYAATVVDFPSASLTVNNGQSADLSVTTVPGETAYAAANVAYSTINTNSYSLQLTYSNASGNALENSITTISGVGTAGTIGSEIGDNTWGFAWTDSAVEVSDYPNQTYYSVPKYGTTGYNIKNGRLDYSYSNVNTTASKKLIFAARFGDDAPMGHYRTSVLLSLVARPIDIYSYSITYDANGGTGAPAAQSMPNQDEDDYDFYIPDDIPTRSGYTFLGWDPYPNALGASLAPGQRVWLYADGSRLLGENVVLYAVWISNSASSSFPSTLTTLQGMNTDICRNVKIGASKTVTDTRGPSGNNSYTIAKLSDGNCWMTQNLRLVNKTVTFADSNISGSYTIPASALWPKPDEESDSRAQPGAYYGNDTEYGAYYSYYTATAGTTGSMSKGQASSDICPKGWRLPRGGDASNTGEFLALYNKYHSTTGGYVVYNGKNGYWIGGTSIATGGAFFPVAGYVSTGTSAGELTATGINGEYWSSTIVSYSNVWLLSLGRSNYISPNVGASNMYRYQGFSMRCVAK